MALLLAVAGCSADGPVGVPPGDPGEPADPTVVIIPDRGPPGTMIRLEGVPGADDPEDVFEVSIGGVVQLAAKDEEGALVAFAPALGPDDGDWPVAPAAPVDVVILRNGDEAATLASAFEILPLTPAPGAVDELVTELADLHVAMVDVLASLTELGSADDAWTGYATAFEQAFEAVFDPTSERSLAHHVGLVGDEEKRLVGAVLAASPLPARLRALRELAEAAAVRDTETGGLAPARAAGDQSDDTRLARYMQLRAIYEATAGGFYHAGAGAASEVNRAAAFLGMSRLLQRFRLAATLSAVISAHFSVYDIFVNDFMVPMMPANVDLSIALDQTELPPGEEVGGTFEITATNNPSAITLGQNVNTVLSVLGAIGSAGAPTESLVQVEDLASHLLGELQASLTSYAEENPEAGVDVDVVQVPLRTWHATIDDPRLLTLLSVDASVIAATGQSALTWTAAQDGRGRTQVEVMPSTDPDALFFGPLSGVTPLQMGAFGTDIATSNRVQVTVRPELEIIAELPDEVERGVPVELVVEARYVGFGGATSPGADVGVSLEVTGGSVAASSGTADAAGTFRTSATLGEGEDLISIEIRAEGDLGQSAEAVVQAAAAGAASVRFLSADVVASASYSIEWSTLIPGSVDFERADSTRTVSELGEVRLTASTGNELEYQGARLSAEGTTDVVARFAVEDERVVIDGFMTGSAEANLGGREFARADAHGSARVVSYVEVTGEVPVAVSFSGTGTPGFGGAAMYIGTWPELVEVAQLYDGGTHLLTLSEGTYVISASSPSVAARAWEVDTAIGTMSGSFRIELEGPLVSEEQP